MRRAEMIRHIRRRARTVGLTFEIERQGREHEIWRCGWVEVAIPRHRVVSPGTTERTFRDLEPVLGEGWWRPGS
jgi:hypothetical protein